MAKKIIGLLIIIFIAVVGISGCIGESDGLKLYENEKISFKYPENYTMSNNTGINAKYRFDLTFRDVPNDLKFHFTVDGDNLPLSERYDNLQKSYPLDENVTDFDLEMIVLNGTQALKQTVKYTDGDYVMFLQITHNNEHYMFNFVGKNLHSVESLYETVTSTIELR
ncbi:MAG: hypothetical protein FWH29_08245 [Methanobrevibacter sp.]|nr:hypothetical protein [Methanobrevibacter sp.]